MGAAMSDLSDGAEDLAEQRAQGAWDAWTAQLALRVLDLADAGVLLIAGPPDSARSREVRPRRWFGLLAARYEDAVPAIALRRAEDHLRGSCVGAKAFGSGFPISPEEDAVIVAAGWHHPGLGDGSDYVRWWPDDVPTAPFLPAEEASRAAHTVATTMREAFGVADPATLSLTQG